MTGAAGPPPPLFAVLPALHEGGAWVVIVGNGMAGAWALAAARWPGLRGRSLWWFTALVELAVVVQAAIGVWLLSVDDQQTPEFHVFYGFLGVFAVAIIYSYRQQLKHRLHLLYGLGGLFIMGLGIRALLLQDP